MLVNGLRGLKILFCLSIITFGERIVKWQWGGYRTRKIAEKECNNLVARLPTVILAPWWAQHVKVMGWRLEVIELGSYKQDDIYSKKKVRLSPDLKLWLKHLAGEVSDLDDFLMLVRRGNIRDEIHHKVDVLLEWFKITWKC